MGRGFGVLWAVVLGAGVGAARRRPSLTPPRAHGLALPRRHGSSALVQIRGGASSSAPARSAPPRGGSTGGDLSGSELVACIMADLCPHGMLPLAWASMAGSATGAVPALGLIVLFGALSGYTLYLAALIAEAAPARFPGGTKKIHNSRVPPPGGATTAPRPPPPPPSAVQMPPPMAPPPPPPPPQAVVGAVAAGGAGQASEALSSVWSKVGLPGARLVDVGVAALCFGCCVFYAAFAADLFHALAARVVNTVPRVAVLAALLAGPVAPLCLGDDLSVLKYSSSAGLVGIAYTALFVVCEALSRQRERGRAARILAFEQSEAASSAGGLLFGASKEMPSSRERVSWGAASWGFGGGPSFEPAAPSYLYGNDAALVGAPLGLGIPAFHVGPGTAVLASALVVAFLCHYNAIAYYRELRPGLDRKAVTPTRYAKVVAVALFGVGAVFAALLFGGRAAFGADAMPNVLNNFPPASTAGALAKLGTGIAILSGFPLMFAGLKSALDEALSGAPSFTSPDSRARRLTHVALLSAIGLAAATASDDDVGTIIELLGSTLGAAAVYVVPGVAAAASPAGTIPAIHRLLGAGVAGLGTALGVFSTWQTLSNAGHGG